MMDGKTLLVTGGTGSFGNAVVDRFLSTGVREIRVFSRDEKKQDDMRGAYRSDKLKFYLGDVRQRDGLRAALHGVDYVFHAAALKQVPSCEFFPMEAVHTNVTGTDNVLDVATEAGVKRVIALSTDKAVYPMNAMGMSKALMEKVMVARARSAEPRRYRGLRNALRQRHRVARLGDPALHPADQGRTAPHPDRPRDDAVHHVARGRGRPRALRLRARAPGDIFVQKAPACTVGDLARALLALFGARNELRVIGTRHGEKRYETLLHREEMARAEDLGDYFRIPADGRDLNYAKYFVEGEQRITQRADYDSGNTRRLCDCRDPGTARHHPVRRGGNSADERPGHGSRGLSRAEPGRGAPAPAGVSRCLCFDRHETEADWSRFAAEADLVFHLAGVNRPSGRRNSRRATGPHRAGWSRCSRAAAGGSRRPHLLHPGGARQPLRAEQEGRRGGGPSLGGAHGRPGASSTGCPTSSASGAAQLQLGGGHVLPQHRARLAHPGQGPGPRAGARSTSTTWWRSS